MRSFYSLFSLSNNEHCNIIKMMNFNSTTFITICILPMILIHIKLFCMSCNNNLLPFKVEQLLKQRQSQSRSNLIILIILMIICLFHQQFDVSGDAYYVGASGDDTHSCLQSEPCLTLDAPTLKGAVESTTEYNVFIMDKTTLSSNFIISSTHSSPRTFTNSPENSDVQSVIEIINDGQFVIYCNSLFEHIKFIILDQASFLNDSVINGYLSESSRTLEIISCSFIGCKAKINGGALYLENMNQAEITLRNLTLDHCEAGNYGGAIYTTLKSGGKLTIAGSCLFTECRAISTTFWGYGGGIYAKIEGENSSLILEDSITFERCSGQTGGGMLLIVQNGGNIKIIGSCNFTDCSSSTSGGGIYLETNDGTVSFNPTEQILIENCNSDNNGGGIYCSIAEKGQISLNNIKFNKCLSQIDGGGLFADINEGGQLTLDKSCEFYQCESYGNGGGICVQIDYYQQCSFLIKDAFIHECKSITNNSLSYPQSGFGGGIFIGSYGDYDPSSELIDLHGMKINGNTADKYGQSLYIVMIHIIEYCKYGILGEYVKGNYSDTYSDENELLGIPLNLSSFNSYSSEEIQQQQQHLEHWWGIFGILNRAQVIVNISNPNGKLIFQIGGQRMIPGYLNVKIFELRDKTQQEIDQEQKEINQLFNKNNLESLIRNSSQFSFTPKIETDNQQQIFINSNLKIKQKLLLDQTNEIIYPPEDGSSTPIQIEGEIQSDQNATFGMNEYKWLNYNQKWYGVLISNNKKIFTGKDGIDFEKDANAAVLLEVIIQEEEKEKGKGKRFPIGIVVGVLVIVSVIIIIIIIALFISNKKSKKVVRSYGHELRARDQPMETKLLLDRHSPDATYQSQDNNQINISQQQPQQIRHINTSREQPYIISSSSSTNNCSSLSDHNFITSWKMSDFEKIKKIGKGAFGTVWKMKEIKSQRVVAIKKVDYDSDEEKQRFNKEVSVIQKVYHILQQQQSSVSQPPFIHVVEPLGYFLNEDKDKAYLVLEYCENGDLRQYIQNMKNSGTEISDNKAFEIIRQVTLALNQLHMNEIIHGDIKPENILLNEDFQIKLSDFGLTRKLQEGRGYTTNHGGTTYYLAPELLLGQSACGKGMQTFAADIWSFGILLFELLAQKHPFFDCDDIELSPLEIYHRIIDEEPAELPDHYSENLKKLIKMMLNKDAARRITAENILENYEVAVSQTKN